MTIREATALILLYRACRKALRPANRPVYEGEIVPATPLAAMLRHAIKRAVEFVPDLADFDDEEPAD